MNIKVIYKYSYISLSRKLYFSPTASVGANAASEARKEEPGLVPPCTFFSQQFPKMMICLIFVRLFAAAKSIPKTPLTTKQNHTNLPLGARGSDFI